MAAKNDVNLTAIDFNLGGDTIIVDNEVYTVKDHKVMVKPEHVQKVQEHIKMIGG